MILKVRVQPRASRKSIIKENDSFKVYLTKPAQDGLANAQLIELLSEHLKVKKYQIKIIQGEKSRNKLIEVNV
jgi:uncharacterized protein (TIGR00251 family)